MIQHNSMTAKQHFTKYEDKKQDRVVSLKLKKQNIVPLGTTVKLIKIRFE